MSQTDWIGDVPKPKFKDIGNTRNSVAEEKARLCLLLTRRCNSAPASLKSGGSISEVRAWKADREAALKVCASKRSSVGDLEFSLNSMAKWA
jgi:hypothetical protein